MAGTDENVIPNIIILQHHGKLLPTFNIKKGIRQECVLSVLLFIIVIHWMMKDADHRTDLNWNIFSKLEYLEIVDDICLITTNRQSIQENISIFRDNAKNMAKVTKPNCSSTSTRERIGIGAAAVEEVQICYLSSVINKKILR